MKYTAFLGGGGEKNNKYTKFDNSINTTNLLNKIYFCSDYCHT